MPGRLALLASLVLALVGCGGNAAQPRTGWNGRLSAPSKRALAIRGTPVVASVTPSTGSRHTVFSVSFVARERTGRIGQARRSYVLSFRHQGRLSGDDRRRGCASGADDAAEIRDARPGRHVRAALNPARMEVKRWCGGSFAGRIELFVGFACPAEGRCKPHGFPMRTKRVGHFAFGVRE